MCAYDTDSQLQLQLFSDFLEMKQLNGLLRDCFRPKSSHTDFLTVLPLGGI